MAATCISLTDVGFKRNNATIFSGINYNVAHGAKVAILGANGIGKSTLLKLLCGMLLPHDGEVIINGLRHGDFTQHLRLCEIMGYAPDVPPVYEHDTVRSYLYFIGTLKKIKHVADAVNYSVECFGLQGVFGKQLGTLSRGMQQRVNLAQAYLGQPEIIILDEPWNGLDVEHAVNFADLLTGLRNDCTMILTTHIYSEFLQQCEVLQLSATGLQSVGHEHFKLRTVGAYDLVDC